MKVTTRKWPISFLGPMWDVLIDGKPIPGGFGNTSRGRVLKMGRRYLAVLDGHERDVRVMGSCAKRSEAAAVVAEVARECGYV